MSTPSVTASLNAAALADDHTRQVAERLGGAIESSTRLALIQALSDAASTISAELAPSSVEVRMVGQDPEFVVSVHTDRVRADHAVSRRATRETAVARTCRSIPTRSRSPGSAFGCPSR